MEKELARAAIAGELEQVKRVEGLCTDEEVEEALQWAAEEGHLEVVRHFTEQGRADVNATDRDGDSAVMKAAGRGHVDVVRYLVERGRADVTARNRFGHTLLMKAAASGRVEGVEYVAQQRGTELNATDNEGDSALLSAARNGDIEVVQYLAQHGADVDMKNEAGETAVRLAANRGHQQVQWLLTRYVTLRSAAEDATPSSGRPSASVIPPSEVELTEFVEPGNVGGEYRAKWLDADVVVKLYLPDASHATFDEEVRLWQQLRHPNVVKMYGACHAGQFKLFVCECASQGSVAEHTQDKSTVLWKFLHEAALGLEYLHERGIAHGDLRCSNILIGSDGLAKLSNFRRSLLQSANVQAARAGSLRWQSPEALAGEQQSLASDVYSLGLCILEAATGALPWSSRSDFMAAHCKTRWTPEEQPASWFDPECPPGHVRDLVWRMCCKAPAKRASLSSITFELERLAAHESLHGEPESDTFADYQAELEELWSRIQHKVDKTDDKEQRQVVATLERIYKRLQSSTSHETLASRFHSLLTQFQQMLSVSTDQARVLRLSSTRAASNSLYAFHWRLESLLAKLGEADKSSQVQWQQQRRDHLELFVSGASDSYLLLEQLKSDEDKAAFLKALTLELTSPTRQYTPEQLDVMNKAYEDIASSVESDELLELTPDWFIPWYELIVDEWNCLGTGGFGSVFRAKWLDSDVVVKRVNLAGERGSDSGWNDSYASFSAPRGSSSAPDQERAQAVARFRSEVAIWFGFSHPHVVRLFGACHVGNLFFVCEHAPHGTLVSFLRAHPAQVWAKLYEAALGVQYLHARRVVHGDLKGNNIMVGSDLKAKVTDFGLSSLAGDDAKPQVSGALHWVAPECFPETNAASQGPTFASDVYSLGMCIVEALRVLDSVEAVKRGKNALPCLPWGRLDNFVVRYHASRGKLPSKPASCDDQQWELVKRMCALEPRNRMRISAVVDELAKLAGRHGDSGGGTSLTESVERVPEVVAKARLLLTRLQDDKSWRGADLALYTSLWTRIEQVHGELDGAAESRTALGSLVTEADGATSKLKDATGKLTSLVECTMRCHALRRRLDKFCQAYLEGES